jgi:hypothetical protein
MKKNETEDLARGLANCRGIEASLAKEKKFLEDSAAEKNALGRTIDVVNKAQLLRMSELLTIEQVGSQRRTYRHLEFADAQIALVDSCRKFAGTVLAPRCRQLEERAHAKVEEKLGQHFPDKDALRAAALQSTELTKLAPIQAASVIHDYGADVAMKSAELLLKAWAAAEAFESEHLKK